MMNKSRLEAFSDGVLAIIITIMVLDLKVPHDAKLASLKPMAPVFSSYLLSFIYIGIYWINHHHLFHATKHVSAGVLWANLHLLFWLSLVPFAAAWMGETRVAPAPTAIYGVAMVGAGFAYYFLERAIIAQQGPQSLLASAVGFDWKGKLSPVCHFAAIPLAFVSTWISLGLFTFVALLWIIPDRRIERALTTTAP